jgi:hypothetical protein
LGVYGGLSTTIGTNLKPRVKTDYDMRRSAGFIKREKKCAFGRFADNLSAECTQQAVGSVIRVFVDDTGGPEAFQYKAGAVKAGGIVPSPDVGSSEIRQGDLHQPLSSGL